MSGTGLQNAEERKKARKPAGVRKMAINISDLPPKYQAQAVKKYMEQQARRGLLPSAAVQDPGR